jgi:hypothetical protein
LETALMLKPEQFALASILQVDSGSQIFGEPQILSGWDFELGTHVEVFFEHGGNTVNLDAEFNKVHVDFLLEGLDSLYLGFLCSHDRIPLLQVFRALNQVSHSSPKAVGAFLLLDGLDHWLLVLADFEAEDEVSSFRALSAFKMAKAGQLGQAKMDELAPFPQANSIPRIIELLGFLAGESLRSADDVATQLGVSYRQALYYLNALKYLGLCSRSGNSNGGWHINLATKRTLETDPPGQVIREAIGECVELMALFEIVSELGEGPLLSHLSQRHTELSDVTIARRVQTIIAWHEWFIENH